MRYVCIGKKIDFLYQRINSNLSRESSLDEDVMKILMPIKEKLEEEGRYTIYFIESVVL